MTLAASDFDYPLDPDLIAQAPQPQRDAARLMALRRDDGAVAHHTFGQLPRLLQAGDLLVVNNTRVVPAKFQCRRKTGAKIDGLFLREQAPGRWEAMLRGAGRCHVGESLHLTGAEDIELRLSEKLPAGRWQIEVVPPCDAASVLQRVGSPPLPPYIKRSDNTAEQADRARYQTIYADRPGAVAAPTAGLHFTEEVFSGLAGRGIETATVTLHVGPGTFTPVKDEDLTKHEMHSEWYDLPAATAGKINAARADGRRIVAVGTTSVRVLEAAGAAAGGGELTPKAGHTGLFLYPPAEFHVVDVLITNFHLPRSTLLMLVAAFCRPGRTDGVEMILRAYAEAGRLRYRFYSYGDAMLIE